MQNLYQDLAAGTPHSYSSTTGENLVKERGNCREIRGFVTVAGSTPLSRRENAAREISRENSRFGASAPQICPTSRRRPV
eukprot:1480465-Rhodomonas_salina.1